MRTRLCSRHHPKIEQRRPYKCTRSNLAHRSSTPLWLVCLVLLAAGPTSDGRLPVVSERARTWHIFPCVFLHFSRWPVTSQTAKAAGTAPWRPSAGAFTFITRHLARPPPSPLYEKMPGAAEAADVQTHWLTLLMLCNQSALIALCWFDSFFSSFLRFRGPVWWWWHPMTNAAAWIMDDRHTGHHLNVFLCCPSRPFSWAQTDYLVSNDIQFPFIVVLVSVFWVVFFFFSTSLKSGHRVQMLWDSSDPKDAFIHSMLKLPARIERTSSAASEPDCRFECVADHLFGA